jgi:hypothetical protein
MKFNTGADFLNAIADALKLPKETTGIEIECEIKDVPRLTVYRIVQEPDLENFGKIVTDKYVLVSKEELAERTEEGKPEAGDF